MLRSLYVLAVFLIWIGCQNDTTETIALATNNGEQWASDLTTQEVEFSAREGVEYVTTGSNSTLRLPPNALVTADGKPYSGKATLKVREYLTKEDMILDNVTTTSYGDAIISEGMYHLEVVDKKGNPLKLTPEKPLTLCQKVNNIRLPLQKFTGERDANGYLNWMTDDQLGYLYNNPKKLLTQENDTLIGSKYDCLNGFFTNTAQLGWINVDYFPLLTTNKGKVMVQDISLGTRLYLVLDDYRSVMPFYYKDMHYIERLPLQTRATVIAFREENGQLLYAEKSIVIGENMEIVLPLQPIEPEIFKVKISEL